MIDVVQERKNNALLAYLSNCGTPLQVDIGHKMQGPFGQGFGQGDSIILIGNDQSRTITVDLWQCSGSNLLHEFVFAWIASLDRFIHGEDQIRIGRCHKQQSLLGINGHIFDFTVMR